MLSILFVILGSIADRARGTKSYLVVLPAALLAGYTFHQNIQIGWYGFTLLFIAYIAGESSGWGNPQGAFLRKDGMASNYHWWQKRSKILRTNTIAALFFRGCMWAFYPSIVCIYLGINPTPYLIFPIWFIMSLYIIILLCEKNRPIKHNNVWYQHENRKFAERLIAKHEWIQGALMAFPFIIIYGDLVV